MSEKRRFDISLRMSVFFGPGVIPVEVAALHPIRMAFTLGGERSPALIALCEEMPGDDEIDILFLVDPDGCREVLGDVPTDVGVWHLTTDQRALALAILDCDLAEPAAQTLRTIKSIELLWSITADLAEEKLVPADGGGLFCERDAQRIMTARRMIDESWTERLTLDSIARGCGLNRAKLTRGFRAMFDCSVTEAIVERRLNGAHHMLLVTDLPVSSIGYRCGYQNNASFARAFTRRFGMAPTRLRASAAA